MSSIPDTRFGAAAAPPASGGSRGALPWQAWIPVGLALLALYGQTIWSHATGIWQTDDHFHGAIVFAVSAWLIATRFGALSSLPDAPIRPAALLLFGLSMLCYLLGRSQSIGFFEIASLPPMLLSVVLLTKGWAGVRLMAFPLFFLVFCIPLPGPVVNALTGPLKEHVSGLVEAVLYQAGLPIARNGVVLFVGPYQMLVADACSGINSMFALVALGTLFMYLVRRTSVLHNAIMLAAIVPIAFAANVLRVAFLVLITYFFGDEAGQGFLHGFSGMALFIGALVMLLAIDLALARTVRPRAAPTTTGA